MRSIFKREWAKRVRVALTTRVARRRVPLACEAPTLPVGPEWDEAFLRVESYLRAHHVESRVVLVQLTSEIVGVARALRESQPGEAPVTLAIRIAQARIGTWLVQNMGEGDWADERDRARGRLALLMSNAAGSAEDVFLSGNLSPAVRARLIDAKVPGSPDIRLTPMPPAPLEFGLADAVEAKWSTFSRGTFFRASMSWLALISIASAAWLITRSP